MDSKEGTPKSQEPPFHTTCPYCFSELDVHLDIKGRPYWRCWRCEVRSFATKTAHQHLESLGWIWSEKQPLQLLGEWLERLARKAGFTKRRKS